jgi:biotin-(acetyl-CoA carboxylase) ligase
VLGDIEGKNGLRLRDLLEMKNENGTVSFTAIPTRVIVRANLNEARHQYETFLNEAGCNYLKQYLEWRMSEKTVRIAKDGKKKTIPPEPLTPDSPIVTPDRLSVGKFLRSNQISGIIIGVPTTLGMIERKECTKHKKRAAPAIRPHNVVPTYMEHLANASPWFEMERRGFVRETRWVGLNDDTTLNMNDLRSKVDKNTKVVGVTNRRAEPGLPFSHNFHVQGVFPQVH